MYMAYDALSDGMKKLIEDLHGIHLSGTRKIANDNTGVTRAAEQKRLNPPVAQPVVRVHPETGRKALYIGEKVGRFDNMTAEESRPLIDYLAGTRRNPNLSIVTMARRTTSSSGITAARCTARSAISTKRNCVIWNVQRCWARHRVTSRMQPDERRASRVCWFSGC